MTTLADTFLDDLEELGEDFGSSEESSEEDAGGAGGAGADDLSLGGGEEDEEEEEANLDDMLGTLTDATGVRTVSKLKHSPKFEKHMAAVAAALATPRTDEVVGNLEDDPEYRLIVTSNQLMIDIDDEISAIHKYVLDLYSKKFPSLENSIPDPMDYFRVVKLIGNEMDMTKVPLADVLPASVVMVVTVTGSSSQTGPLSPEDLQHVIEGCDEAQYLSDAKATVLKFVESRMNFLAPNISAILGTTVAAKLLGAVGGLHALSNMPSCNIKIIGQKKKQALGGYSAMASLPHTGFIYYSPVVQNAPSALRMKVADVVANKVALAARVDVIRSHKQGEHGQELYQEVLAKIAKWQEPPPAKQKKPLKAPDDVPKKRRGGKRYRRMKEKMGLTDLEKEANRLSMTMSEETEYGDSAMGKQLGMVGQPGSGRLRITRKEKKNSAKKMKKAVNAGSSGATAGFASSLAFTPVQGFELPNPSANKAKHGNDSYFSATGTFTQIRPGT